MERSDIDCAKAQPNGRVSESTFSEPADLTSGLPGRVTSSSIPKSAPRPPKPIFKSEPQPFPYAGHDFPELYGPKVRVIR